MQPSAFGGFGTHVPGRTIQSVVSRLHLQIEICTNGYGKTTSTIPLIIFVFGEFRSPVLEGVFSHLLHAIAMSRDWAFSNSRLEVWLPAFQLPMFAKRDTAERRFMRHTCLRNPCLLWNLSLHFLPEAWGSWGPQHPPPALHYGWIMPIPSLQLQNKAPVWCREAKWPPRFVIYNTVISRPVLPFCPFRVTVGWKWGCQHFSYPCSQNVMHCREEICSTCLSEESMPFVKSKPPLPTRSLRSLRAAASSTSSLWLYHACKR